MLEADLVSIGVPTYNAAATIEPTLRAIQAQSHPTLEVIISDNGSSDATVDIAMSVVGDDERFRVVAHETNRGWQHNFRFVLSEASGPYFMWVGADDRPAPNFVSANVALLKNRPDLVSSISRVRWLHDGQPGELAAGSAALTGSARENVARYLRRARDNSRFYGLHRTAVLRDSFPAADFYGLDLAVMIGTLRHGGHGEVDDVLLARERSDATTYVDHIERDAQGFVDRLLPMSAFTRSIVGELKAPMSPMSILWLGLRNLFEHLRYWSTTSGVYGKLTRPIFARLDTKRAAITSSDDEGNRHERQ